MRWPLGIYWLLHWWNCWWGHSSWCKFPGTVWYQCNDRDFEEKLNDLLGELNVENNCFSGGTWPVWKCIWKNRVRSKRGSYGLSFVHPMDMRRYWLDGIENALVFVGLVQAVNLTNQPPSFILTIKLRSNAFQLPMAVILRICGILGFCFTPDTKVPLLDGRNLTLEQIYAELVQVNFGFTPRLHKVALCLERHIR